MKGPLPRRLRIRRHYEMLIMASIVIVAALILEVRADDRVCVTGLERFPLPPSCMSQILFRVRCPGCGLTRSIVHLAHGEWQASWQAHRVGWLLALSILVQFPYRLWCLFRGDVSPLNLRLAEGFGYALIAALIGNWVLTLFGL